MAGSTREASPGRRPAARHPPPTISRPSSASSSASAKAESLSISSDAPVRNGWGSPGQDSSHSDRVFLQLVESTVFSCDARRYCQARERHMTLMPPLLPRKSLSTSILPESSDQTGYWMS